jgi:hypothetical protein
MSLRWPTRRVENALRHVLGLPAYNKQRLGIGFHISPDGFMVHASDAEVEAEFNVYHAAGWRGEAASRLALAPFAVNRRLRQIRDGLAGPLALRRARQAIFAARSLTFTSHYTHCIGHTSEVEGWITPTDRYQRESRGDAPMLSISVTSAQAFVDLARDEWQRGEVVRETGVLSSSQVNLIVPQDSLTDEIVRDALERWYMDIVQYRRGHWAVRERDLPEFRIELAWVTPQKYASHGFNDDPTSDADAEARWKDSAERLAEASSSSAERRFSRFGRS